MSSASELTGVKVNISLFSVTVPAICSEALFTTEKLEITEASFTVPY